MCVLWKYKLRGYFKQHAFECFPFNENSIILWSTAYVLCHSEYNRAVLKNRKMYINEFTIRQSNAIIHNVTFHWFQIWMPISIRFFTDVPFILVFQANQNQINESSAFGLTCMVNSSSSLNMSIQNKETGEVIRTGMSTDTLSFTETAAKCYQTAEYICIATNIAGSIKSSPVKILVNFSINFSFSTFNYLQTN